MDQGSYVTSLSYSPLLGGFTVVINDGRAAFLVAATLKFDPNSVQVNGFQKEASKVNMIV